MRHILTVILVLAGGIPSSAQPRPESVCDVLADLVQHSGKLVLLRDRYAGVMFIGGRECAKPVWVGEIQFENIVNLEWPGNPVVKARKQEIPFDLDEKSSGALERAIGSWDRRSQDLYITVEGLLVTRTPPFNLVILRNPPQRIGFGHLGSAPAELVIKLVREVVASPKGK